MEIEICYRFCNIFKVKFMKGHSSTQNMDESHNTYIGPEEAKIIS